MTHKFEGDFEQDLIKGLGPGIEKNGVTSLNWRKKNLILPLLSSSE